MQNKIVVSESKIQNLILIIRGERVIIDADLAEIYGVTTKQLNRAVKRNIDRFPSDFMFQLTQTKKNYLVANCDHLAKLKFSYRLIVSVNFKQLAAYIIWFGTHKEYDKINTETIEFDTSILNYKVKK